MSGSPRSGNYGRILAICMITLVLAVALPAFVTASSHVPPPTPGNTDSSLPPPPAPTRRGGTATPTPTRTPTPGDNGYPSPPTDPLPADPTITEAELIKALAPNRIVFHAATPVQLCKVEDGLQVYFVGRKGKTRLGPWVPSFAELAANNPTGAEVSIYFGFNPLTGKRVKIDYLPSVHRIRVDTFYADRDTRQKQSLHLPLRPRTRHHLRRLVT